MTRDDLPTVRPWFDDPDTVRFLGGPDWPARMLDLAVITVGQEFRGAVQTSAAHYVAMDDDQPVGYVDCGTFDRWAVHDGTAVTEVADVVTGYVALCADPAARRQGAGRAMLDALVREPALADVQRFAAGVDPDNLPCMRCLRAAGFRLYSTEPDYEGMLYYLRDR
jgi:RimJ/RimL family protein N-acetyltransferase